MNKIIVDNKDLLALKTLDPVLSKYIEKSEKPNRYYAESFFNCVVTTIIGQLISTKSAATIYKRLEDILIVVNVDNFLATPQADIIACGIYKKKYDQIHNIAKNLKSGILDFHELALKSDEEIIKVLTGYPGIGLWSAEMIMIFGLRHPDILAFGDFGVRSGIKKVYVLETLSKKQFLEIKQRLSPYGTLASLYFWQAHTKE